jgi:hypothetical protein
MRVVAIIASMIIFAGVAEAREGCNEEGYKVTHTGDRIPTQACQAQLFGKVARAHKIRVRSSPVMKNPAARHELCHLIGYDVRLEVACRLRINHGR